MSTLRRVFHVLSVALCCLVFVSPLGACDTPVYRYAMYRWPASKYYVFHVHTAPPTKEEQAVNQAIREMEAAEEPKPNVVFFDIDVKEIETAPPIASEHWKKIGKPASTYIVVAPPPLGGVVYDGKLTLADVRSMVASPLRTEIANRLEEGAATVFVLLESDEKKLADDKSEGAESPVTNKSAAALAELVVNEVNSGAITLYATPKPGEVGDPTALKPEHKIATVTLSRDNPDEQWLIRMLLAVESDLHEFNQPMVFPVYGRGRVHPPFLGLGVTQDNLTEAVQFVTGACSCTVKEQNPGVDLLFDYDWEAAAVAMAEKFGAEEGNEQLNAADLFPQLIIPGASETIAAEGDDASRQESESVGEASEAAAIGAADAGESADSPAVAHGEDDAHGDGRAGQGHEDRQVALATAPEEELSEPIRSGAMTSVWVVLAVLGGATVFLFFATLIVLRRR